MLGAFSLRSLAAVALIASCSGTGWAQDTMKIAVGQGGGWEQSVSELGQKAGIFKKHGLTLEVLYTQGSAETLQSVISGSIDVGTGLGTHSVLGAIAKGAPIRIIAGSFTGADDQYYYVPAESPIKTMKDADGKTIAISTNGSSSHMFVMALARQYGIKLVPRVAGNYASTLTQTMTKQVDIGFAQAPFNLTGVEEGKVRVIASGRDLTELSDETCRVLIANAGALTKRHDAFVRYMRGFRETLAWMYSDPAAIKAYAAFSGIPERIAARVPAEFQKPTNLDPDRMSGLDKIMTDAVTFKYLAAPLTAAQLKEAIQIPAP